MIKAIVFDMDGVLVDARDWHYQALNRALGLFGFQISHDDHLSSFDGLPTSTKLEMLTNDQGLPAGLHLFINSLKQQYTVELIHEKCRPVFAHEYAISRLKNAGYKIAVASNSIGSTVELMMSKAGLSTYLDVQVAATDVENSKPHPEIYHLTAQKLGLDPSECLVVEDSQFGVAAALASGANLLEVSGVEDVNYFNINARLLELEGSVPK